MPRIARQNSSTGIYHVMLRGNNKETIFFEKEDFELFFSALKKYKSACGYTNYAWCLMPNHIHLVFRERNTSLGQSMQKILISFVSWYNRKYGRIGHVFQDRFRSEPIESSDYFLRAIRYVHLNPVKGGICDFPGTYPYSSYAYYFQSGKYSDSDMIYNLIRKDEFERFHFEDNEDRFIDIDDPDDHKFSDSDFVKTVHSNSTCEQMQEIRFLPETERKQLIKVLLNRGADIPQISRLTRMTVNQIKRDGDGS